MIYQVLKLNLVNLIPIKKNMKNSLAMLCFKKWLEKAKQDLDDFDISIVDSRFNSISNDEDWYSVNINGKYVLGSIVFYGDGQCDIEALSVYNETFPYVIPWTNYWFNDEPGYQEIKNINELLDRLISTIKLYEIANRNLEGKK